MQNSHELQSMTGFGSAENEMFSVEIRSVNHRFFDVYFRTPQFLNRYEIELKKRLKESFARGRFDVNISMNPEKENIMRVNNELVSGMIDALSEIKERFSLKGDITVDVLAGFKDVFISDTAVFEDSELFESFDRALVELREMRTKEGLNIKKELKHIAETVEGHLKKIIRESDGLNERLRKKFLKRIHQLIDESGLDESRLVQEVAILAERADISEEIARLQSHIKQFHEILEEGGLIGRKLDFLLQEFFRETNTIASKTSEYNIVATVLDMKTEIERLREQVQNVQ